MARKSGRQQGAQRNAEGQHGDKTHRRFIEQLHEGTRAPKMTDEAPVEGNHRLHQDREQHDEAEKNSEKVEAMREIDRGKVDDDVLAHARIPHEGDAR